MSEQQAVAVFTALADPMRRELMRVLAVDGPATVTELAARLPITRQAVAKHLAQLVDAGLLTSGEPEGRRVRYRVDTAPIRAAQAWLAYLAHTWDERLDALRQHVETA